MQDSDVPEEMMRQVSERMSLLREVLLFQSLLRKPTRYFRRVSGARALKRRHVLRQRIRMGLASYRYELVTYGKHGSFESEPAAYSAIVGRVLGKQED